MRDAQIPTVTELVKRAEVTRNTVYNWEGGKSAPALDELDKVAKTLDVPLSRLVDAWSGRDTTKEPPPQWAEAMEARIVSEVQQNRAVLMEALAAGFAEQAARELDEDNDDEGQDGKSDQPPGGAGPRPTRAP